MGDVEDAQDVLVGLITDGTEQGGHRQFLLPVDISVHHIVDVSGELHPGTLEGDDTGGVQWRAVGVIGEPEEHTRRTVQLRHDHTLGAVDDEGAAGGHVGDHAQIDILDDGLEVLMLDIVAGELEFRLQGDAECQASFQAFIHGVAGGVDGVIQELKDVTASRIRDGEIFSKRAVQTLVVAAFGIRVYLEELLERLELDIQKVRIGHRSRGCKAYSVIIISCQGYYN